MSNLLPVLIRKADPDAMRSACPVPIVTTGDKAVAVLDPVPVTVSGPVQGVDGVENVADHVEPVTLNPVTVEAPEQPPPQVALVRPDGAATAKLPLPGTVELIAPPGSVVNAIDGTAGVKPLPPPPRPYLRLPVACMIRKVEVLVAVIAAMYVAFV